jgi:hypothetical protein
MKRNYRHLPMRKTIAALQILTIFFGLGLEIVSPCHHSLDCKSLSANGIHLKTPAADEGKDSDHCPGANSILGCHCICCMVFFLPATAGVQPSQDHYFITPDLIYNTAQEVISGLYRPPRSV